MANEKNPSIYDDRSAIGSSDELDTYGVWVKSGPQDILETEADTIQSDDADDLPDFGDFPGGGEDSPETDDFSGGDFLGAGDLDLNADEGAETGAADFDTTGADTDDFELPDFSGADTGAPLDSVDLALPGDDTETAADFSRDFSSDNSEDNYNFDEFNDVALDDITLDDFSETGGSTDEAADASNAVTGDGTSLDDFFMDDDFFSTDELPVEIEPADVFPENPRDPASPRGSDVTPTELSNQLLLKIVNELSSIKTELSSLKDELTVVQGRAAGEAGTAEKSHGGFFDAEEDDETIALTGDEMDNILKGADFTEEQGATESPDLDTEALTAESPASPDETPVEEPVPVIEEMPVEEPAPDEAPAEEIPLEEAPAENSSFADIPLETAELSTEEPAAAEEPVVAEEFAVAEEPAVVADELVVDETIEEIVLDLPDIMDEGEDLLLGSVFELPGEAAAESAFEIPAEAFPFDAPPADEAPAEQEPAAADWGAGAVPPEPVAAVEDSPRELPPLEEVPEEPAPDINIDLTEDEPLPAALTAEAFPDFGEPIAEDQPAATTVTDAYDFEQIIPEAFSTGTEEPLEEDAALFDETFTADAVTPGGGGGSTETEVEDLTFGSTEGLADDLAIDFNTDLGLDTVLDEPTLDDLDFTTPLDAAPDISNAARDDAADSTAGEDGAAAAEEPPAGVIFEDLDLDIPEEETASTGFDAEAADGESFPDITLDAGFGEMDLADTIPEPQTDESLPDDTAVDFLDDTTAFDTSFDAPVETAALEADADTPEPDAFAMDASFTADAEPEGGEETAPPAVSAGNAEPETGSEEFAKVPVRIKNELRTVLSYMDQLLESLPEEKIQEFARSEYFDTYKKLFEELGLV